MNPTLDNTLLEDGSYVFTAADFGFTDPSDTPGPASQGPANSLFAVKITTLPTNGSLTNNNVAVTAGQFISVSDINAGGLRFTPTANTNSATRPRRTLASPSRCRMTA